MTICELIRLKLENENNRSAWAKGVNNYAFDLVDELEEATKDYGRDPFNSEELKKWCLNGADGWTAYSYNGCSLCYNTDIAERLCTPSELKKKRGGVLNPSSRESWLDVQARALYQAFERVKVAFNEIENGVCSK